MIAVATAWMPPKQAMSLARKITGVMIDEIYDPTNSYYISRRYVSRKHVSRKRTENIIEVAGDWTGALFGLRAVPGGLEFFGETCGGSFHALRIYRCGRVEAEQRGLRGSSGSIMFDCIPPEWWDISRSMEWELTQYATSRPDWAVYIALIKHQRFGGDRSNSPAYLWEEKKLFPRSKLEDEYENLPRGGVVGMGRSHTCY